MCACRGRDTKCPGADQRQRGLVSAADVACARTRVDGRRQASGWSSEEYSILGGLERRSATRPGHLRNRCARTARPVPFSIDPSAPYHGSHPRYYHPRIVGEGSSRPFLPFHIPVRDVVQHERFDEFSSFPPNR